MLAARGVSLGLGRINLSDLNQLPKADRALLGKLKREQKAEQKAREQKVVVRKHVDAKTLLTACATVVVGAALMALGLLMTIVGYFDSDMFSSAESFVVVPAATKTADQMANSPNGDSQVFNGGKRDAADPLEAPPVSWFRFLLKSMQYAGPVLMGVGMFLLIIIIQEESTELRRSRRKNTQQSQQQRTRSCEQRRAEATTTVMEPIERDDNADAAQMVRENGTAGKGSPASTAIGKRSIVLNNDESQRLIVRAEVHQSKQQQCANNPNNSNAPTIGDFSLISEEPSSTDAMAEYTFPNLKVPLSGGGRTNNKKRVKLEEQPQQQIRPEKAEKVEEPKRLVEEKRGGRGLSPGRRKSTSAAISCINRKTPRGPAPLVRVESLVELSLSAGSSPSSTAFGGRGGGGTPRKKAAFS